MSVLDPFDFDRSFRFDVPPEQLWARLGQTDQFTAWWRWLRKLDTHGRGLEPGTEADCVVRGPLPYELRLTIAVAQVVPGRIVEAVVDGDLRGPARLEVNGAGAASEARLVWSLEVIDPALRALTRVARPLMSWGHDVVVTRGLQQFRRHGLGASV